MAVPSLVGCSPHLFENNSILGSPAVKKGENDRMYLSEGAVLQRSLISELNSWTFSFVLAKSFGLGNTEDINIMGVPSGGWAIS